MLSETQVKEIREIIENSENPLYFFDCDNDGLASYILLYKKYQKGKGVVVKGSATLDVAYLRKVEEHNPDLVVVLDKPLISQDFIDKVHVPIIWLDHHPLSDVKGVKYYNPRQKYPDLYLPTTYLAYQVADGEMWVAALGIIGDYAIPDFIEEFRKKYPDLIGKEKEPGRIIYETEFGKLIRMYNFLLKGKTSDVNKSIAILTKIDEPYELLNKETPRAKYLWKRAEKVEKEYKELLNKAEKWVKKDEILLFTYPSKKISLSGDLSVELSYRHPDKIIVVGREKSGEIKLSFRSRTKRIDEPLKKALTGIEGYGGGHEYTCGANIKKEDFTRFIKQFREAIQEQPLRQQ
ncbi:MAG: DHHA1 domain-containing protein [Candidatus Nanoarchaeia archaeon]